MSLIKIRNLDVLYKTGYKTVFALKNVNLDINSGEYVCIVGNNGTGKSSLIKSILGLLPVNLGNITLNCNKNLISYIPQLNTIPFDFPATVYELVLSGMQKANNKLPFYSKKDNLDANEAIKLVSLEKFKKRRISELSGGQQQRVLLARALAKKPEVLILDEPCTGLDAKTTENFYQLLRHLNKAKCTTVIMISHDFSNVEKYATRVIRLDNEVLFDGPTDLWIQKRNVGELSAT